MNSTAADRPRGERDGDVVRPQNPSQSGWRQAAVALIVVAAVLVAWRGVSPLVDSVDEVVSLLEPYRDTWYALPAVVVAFVALGIVLVPVTLLIGVTGIAFGSVLGPIYAMAGCLASGSAGFAIGRRLGMRRLEAWGGARIKRLAHGLRRNGTLAVFFVRKLPAPFTLVNIVIGASTVRYRDFLVGTSLGMAALVVALAGFGHHLMELLQEPSVERVLGATLIVAIPMVIAWAVNRVMRARQAP